MAMDTHAEVDLSDRVEAGQLKYVDEEAELHAVTRDEGHAFQEGPAARVLAPERLHHAGEQGPVQVDERARHEFGHPAAATRDDLAAVRRAVRGNVRTVVAALHITDGGVGQQGPQQSGHV